MKNIMNYNADKYLSADYVKMEEGIYKHGDEFVTSLSFEQESSHGEGESPKNISQYPLEDILDKFYVYISDFYEELNSVSSIQCYLEFASDDLQDIKNLRSIIGKHI